MRYIIKRTGETIGATLAITAFFLVSCKDPKLASEAGSKEMEEVVASESGDSYDKIRQTVIGRKFESLTLGQMQFSSAEVRDINDQFIVVSHAGGLDKVLWSDVSEEVKERWGYNPSAESAVKNLAEMIPDLFKPSTAKEVPAAEAPEPPASLEPKTNPQERAQAIRQRERMLEAQIAGIKTIESDLSRHSIALNSLRVQLQSTRALQSGQRSGGIRIKRIDGESTLIDRKAEARQLEAQIKVEEQLVDQLTKSLQAALKTRQTLQLEVIQLRHP